MNKVEIFEQHLKQGDRNVGKVAILRGGLGTDNPTGFMNDEVSKYVGQSGFNQFVEIHLDNPWVRVIISGINDLDYQIFENQKLNNEDL
jgi:hypothetical protein